MKNFAHICLVGTALLMSAPVFAENRAANINIVSDGRGVDAAALQSARKIVGQAIANKGVRGRFRTGLKAGECRFETTECTTTKLSARLSP